MEPTVLVALIGAGGSLVGASDASVSNGVAPAFAVG